VRYSCTAENTQHPAVQTPSLATCKHGRQRAETLQGSRWMTSAGVHTYKCERDVESCLREKLLNDGRMAIGNHLLDRPSPRAFPPSSSLPPSHFLSVSCGVSTGELASLSPCHHPQRRETFVDGWAQGFPLAGGLQGWMGDPILNGTNRRLSPESWAPVVWRFP
jgi:hypothetical protein